MQPQNRLNATNNKMIIEYKIDHLVVIRKIWTKLENASLHVHKIITNRLTRYTDKPPRGTDLL